MDGKGTNRLEPQTQCLVRATDGFAQRVLPLGLAGFPGPVLREAHSLCTAIPTAAAVASVVYARAITIRFDFGANRRTNDRN